MAVWARDHPALAGWCSDATSSGDSDGHLPPFLAPVSSPRTDAMQAALVSLAQRGDDAAAMALLVQLRPGLVRLHRQLAFHQRWTRSDAVQEVRAVFLEVLSAHRLDRRPTKIAANLLLDTRQRLHRTVGRRTPPTGIGTTAEPVEVIDGTAVAHDVHTLSPVLAYETLRTAAAALPGTPSSRQLTTNVGFRAWVLGQSGPDIADELNLSAVGVRTRLHRFRAAVRDEFERDRAA